MGEKLKEELFYGHEKVTPTSCDRIKRTNGSLRDWMSLSRQLAELRASLTIAGAAPVRAKMKEIVPEYTFHDNKAKQDTNKPIAERQFRAVAGHD